MGVSQAAVRRHLDGLRADGLIDVRIERHGVGRPALLFSATERGEELVGRGYLHLISRLFRTLDQMGPSEVAGQSGRDVLESAFQGVAHEIAADHRAEVLGMTLAQRVDEASRALKSEGIVDGWERVGDTFHILNSDCPYLRLAEMTDAPCCADRLSIELLIGAPVEQTKRIAANTWSGSPTPRPNAPPDLFLAKLAADQAPRYLRATENE
jgi:predicted ArsR family transcriptional regulator